MQKTILTILLGATLMSVPLALPAVEGGSIASKVESLGEMTYLKFTDMRAVRRDGLLRVQVSIFNENSANEQLYYRFRWLDEDGFTVWEEEPWKPEIVYGRQSKVLSVTAPTLKAQDFRIEVQSPNNSTTLVPNPPGSVANQ
ncbi:MAG: YcfL family protein [Zoogloeaceae bacterium]|jgi:hypothetical protein|nr:YcfL family protein [Zoogloeaceae bacterium]